jgi:hypothetical protein
MSSRLLNYLLYEAGWFACILGAAWGHPWRGTMLGVIPLVAHVALVRRRREAVALILWTALIGLVVDTAQIGLGTLHFTSGTLADLVGRGAAWLPPPWLTLVWAQFAMTFHFGLSWLKRRPGRAALFGLIGGPLAFLCGRRLGVVTLHPDLWPSLLSLAATWGVAMPAALALATRQDQLAGGDDDRAELASYRWP